MKKTEEFLEQLGIKRAYGDFESFKRFNDGGQYRFEVPGIQSPKIMDTLLKEASKNEITIHRITQTKGIMLLTDEEITEISEYTKSDEVAQKLAQNRDLVENQIKTKRIPTMIFDGKKHEGLYKAS